MDGAFQPTSGVIVKAGVPRDDQRKPEPTCEVVTERSHVARASDMDEIGNEFFYFGLYLAGIAEEKRVVIEVRVELEDGDCGVLDPFRAGAAVDAEERYLTGARERFKVTAGVCDAVHLVKCVGQKSGAEDACQMDASESDQMAFDQTVERSSRAKRNAPCTPRRSRKRMTLRKC